MHGPLHPAPLPLVRYAVRVATIATSAHPATAYEPEHWHLRALELDEALDLLYRLDLHLVTDDVELDIDTLLGAEVTVTCNREGDDERLIHGVVERTTDLGTYGERLHLRLEVGPALARLRLSQRSRVFQGLTAIQVAQQVTAEAFAPYGREVDTTRLLRSYDELDYCVQFRETDLAFVQRILAREGIGFFFEHGPDAERMVLFDDPRALQGANLDPTAEESTPSPVVTVSTARTDLAGTESILGFELQHRVSPARVDASSWDWMRWQPAHALGQSIQRDPAAFGQWHLHGERRLVEQSGQGAHLDHTSRTAKDAHAYFTANSRIARGRGNVLAFGPGRTFDLEGHPHTALDRPYALLRVVHRADCPEADADDTGTFAGPNYDNRFECIPAERPWHPRPLSRPNVHGHLLATVVGPPGEEIHTDVHGRIKVWIHWDREHGPHDPDSSCWLRVAQPWAGAGWGSMFLPRVGMQVLVSFVDGDPDRPLCMGCVYDGRNQPPYPLPEQRTRSTIKTRSTPGGEGYNELRFEDAAGQEEIFVHAERDLVEHAGHDHQRRVRHRESIEVDDDRTVTVGGSQSTEVTGNHRLVVGGRSPEGIPLPSPHHAIEVEGDSSLSATRTIHLRADTSITLQVQSTTLTLTPGGIMLRTGPGASATLDAGIQLCSSPGATLNLGASGGLAVAAMAPGGAPGATLALDASATVASPTGATLSLSDQASLGAAATPTAAGAHLTLGAGATMSGHTVAVQSSAATLTLDTGAALEAPRVQLRGDEVSCEGTQTTLRGQRIAAEGGGLITLDAPLVRLN